MTNPPKRRPLARMKSRWHNIMLFWRMCQDVSCLRVSCLRICEFSGCAQDRIGLSGDVQGLTFDLHNAIGLFSSLFLLLFALTGTYLAFEPLFYAITHSKPVTQPAFSNPQVGLKPVSLELVATAANDTLPGATLLWINIPRQPREAYFAKMRFPEDRSDNGSSMVWIDQFSGKVLAVSSSRTAPLGNKIQNVNRLIHTGSVLGNGGRAFAAFVSLILVLQTLTGLQLWWNGRRRKVPSASASQP